ncbi:MAG: acyl-CoA desaturase [Ignavibacteria bacterium]|nr:acyl-CoA desaturase [Ignavibacteria bacterium]
MKLKGKVKFVSKDKSSFFDVLKDRVDQYFIDNNLSKHANTTMVIKTISMLLIYFTPFALILIYNPPLWICLLLWLVMGLGLAGIGMSVMHDANHSAYSSNKSVNFLVGHTLNLIGGHVENWKLQHNILHHTYTNIIDMDEDINDRVALRFSPHTPVKKFHKIQYFYAFALYGFLTIYWAFLKDFLQFFQFRKSGVSPSTSKINDSLTLLRIIGVKAFYFFVFLIAPIVFFNIPVLEVFLGFFIMHFFASVILSTIFQLAHTVEETTHPLPDAQGNIENLWAIHQLNTTCNFSRNSKVLTWYLGGLNYQVEHHLFPRICHVHYPKIAGIVKQTAEEFGIKYLENETFSEALNSHILTLKRFGKLPDLNEVMA